MGGNMIYMTTTHDHDHDHEDTWLERAAALDADHPVKGVSEFGDDISDYCASCGYAVGWRTLVGESTETFGHTPLTTDAVSE